MGPSTNPLIRLLIVEYPKFHRFDRRIYSGKRLRENMTSIIQTMNSRGVAFATDSAVSYGDHSRNSAQKLFSLPGRQPIAFMTMGFGEFAPAGLSWDRIFYKYNLHYSKKYGIEAELDTVEEYEKDFIGFLESLVSEEDNALALEHDIWRYWAGAEGILNRRGYLETPEDDSTAPDDLEDRDSLESPEWRGLEAVKRLMADGNLWRTPEASDKNYADIEFQYKTEQLEKHHASSLKKAAEWILMSSLFASDVPKVATWEKMNEALPSKLQEETTSVVEELYMKLKRWLAAWGNIHSWKQYGSKSDVVFGGFGRNDDYPSTTHIVTGSRVLGLGDSDKLVYDRNTVVKHETEPIQDEETGTWKCNAFLESFAQDDFILRMTTGMAKRLDGVTHVAVNNIDGWLHYQGAQTIAEVKGVSEELAESVVSHLEKEQISRDIGSRLNHWVVSERTRVKQEFRQAVVRLSSVELAELAYELVGVQAKMHNIVYSQASVDLPVDVCYMSKENGFVWHSRKNMPDLELNPRISSMDWPGSQLD